MVYHFNFYEERHGGYGLFQLSDEEYRLCIEGDDDDWIGCNPISLDLDKDRTYHLYVSFEYSYHEDRNMMYRLSDVPMQLPFEYQHFILKIDPSIDNWGYIQSQ